MTPALAKLIAGAILPETFVAELAAKAPSGIAPRGYLSSRCAGALRDKIEAALLELAK